jgi:glyoxylase-like metal-dependent hydrolase (beta-lactamase superfamily II)
MSRGVVDLGDVTVSRLEESYGPAHLELRPGHTPGHSAGWLTGSGGTGLFSGDAVLMPAHFSAPHAFKVKTRGDGFGVVGAL